VTTPPASECPDYRIDAPTVVDNQALIGAVSLLLAASRFFLLSFRYPIHGVALGRVAFCLGLTFLATTDIHGEGRENRKLRKGSFAE